MRVSNNSLALKAALAQPFVGESESLAAVIVLAVLDADRATVLEHGDVERRAIRHVRHQLGQMQRRVRVVIDAEEQNLPIELVNSADGTLRPVRRER
jgi:hypothetical protein